MAIQNIPAVHSTKAPLAVQEEKAPRAGLNPPFIPGNAGSVDITVYTEPGATQPSGYYTITVTYKPDPITGVVPPPEIAIVAGQTMVLMMGAFVTQKIEQSFTTLFQEVQARNEKIQSIKNLMPIIVTLQTLVGPGGYTIANGKDSPPLPANAATIWKENAIKAGLPTPDQDLIFTQSEVTEILNVLQNSLSNETQASEKQMMDLNVLASRRTAFFNLMQSNAALFKQSLSASANGG